MTDRPDQFSVALDGCPRRRFSSRHYTWGFADRADHMVTRERGQMTPKQAAEAMKEACARKCETGMKNTERELFSDDDDKVSRICLMAGRIGAYSRAATAIRALNVEDVSK